MLLTDGNRKAAQRLWLRKVRIHREAPPDARHGLKGLLSRFAVVLLE